MSSARSRIRIRDVAQKAGVSECTVSKVLNGKGERISSETHDLVQRVASEIGYRPNRFAKLLGQTRTGIIGVIISGLDNPVYADAARLLDDILRQRGYQALFEIPINNEMASQRERTLEWPVDGFLIWADPVYDVTLTHGPLEATPIVTVGTERTDGQPSVAFDLYDGGRQAARRLIERGCRRLAHVCLTEQDPRSRGFCETAQDAGMPVELISVAWDEQTRDIGLGLGEKLARRVQDGDAPDGVFCHNDLLAVGVHRGLRRASVAVPEQVALVGFDGIEEGRFLETPLTTINAPMESLCIAAVDALLVRIAHENDTPAPSASHLIPVRLRDGGTA